ncbi:HVO_0476 family zinc finger protein [Thermococcus celer]|uniref:Translation initiation factor 2 n=1 Tax=Thermococcus celer Vu 13 = JCM 8558 TaxID=1293037 RepID=A0A218P148_THECE|nr:HVO_0476 family zinc finger protein [Thermococcus celer]ASI98658.1 translation initiation factor 2 [Thermococcus celer Vu 13 = JCM 8558]
MEWFTCPECGSDDVEVIRERGREVTLRCNECGNVWMVTLPKPIKVPLIVSKHERSFKTSVELPGGEEIKVGDIVETEDDEVRITGIELEGDKRVERAVTGEIKTLWGESLTYPKVIKASIYLSGGTTQAFKVKVPRDEEFVVGEVLEVGGYTFRVEKIKTERKMLHHGKAKADEIVAIMGHHIPRARARRKLEIYRGYSKESG